jgi:transcriptional regulator with XRE-family HTH domain
MFSALLFEYFHAFPSTLHILAPIIFGVNNKNKIFSEVNMKRTSKDDISTIYSRIHELASQKKISLAELERTLHFSNGIISTWKSSNPSIDKISKVANYFNVSTDYLLGNTNNSSPATKKSDNDDLTWQDLDMPYGGKIPNELKKYYRAIAQQYVNEHPEEFK